MISRFSANTLTLLVSNGGSALLSFALSVLIGRVLGQDGLGVYATALAWVFPLSLLAEFGLSTLITREVAQNLDSAADLLRDTTPARFGLGGGLVLVLVLIAPFLTSDAHIVQGIRISAPLVVIAPFFGAFTAVFRAHHIMWPVAWLNLGMLAAQVVLTALVFLAGADVIAALIVNVITSGGQLGAAWAIWRWKFHENAGAQHTAPQQTRVLLTRAWPFALAGILAAIQLRLGVILLERLTNASEVGLYVATSRFVEAGRMIPNALFGALFPILAALVANPTEMARIFWRVMLGLTILGAALGILFSLFASPIIRLTYHDEFLPAAPVLQIAMWSLLPSMLRGARTLYWYARGREGFVNAVTAASLALQIAFSLWLIPQQGALGVALVILVVESVVFVALMWGRNVPAN